MTKKTQNRREFLKTGAAGLAAITLIRNAKAEIPVLPTPIHIPGEITILTFRQKMKSGARLATVRNVSREADQTGRHENSASVAGYPDALAIANQMDKEAQEGQASFAATRHSCSDKRQHCRQDAQPPALALLDAPSPKQAAFVAIRVFVCRCRFSGKTNLSE
jgi:hypothetical protein